MRSSSRRKFLCSSAAFIGAIPRLTAEAGTEFGLGPVIDKLEIPPVSRVFDTRPDHINWAVNSVDFGSPLVSRFKSFKYTISYDLLESRSFRQSVIDGVRKLDHDRNGRTIALAYSGGIDSEIIARILANESIPFELYFLNAWNANQDQISSGQKLARELKVPLNVVQINKSEFLEDRLKQNFLDTACVYPTPLVLVELFRRIPKNQFIVTGEGGLDKRPARYQNISATSAAAGMPFSIADIAYRIWAEKNGRQGQFYFFNSSPEIIGEMLLHPKLKVSLPMIDTNFVFREEFPEIRMRSKTTNWGAHREDAVLIKTAAKKLALNAELSHLAKEIFAWSMPTRIRSIA